MLVDHLAKKGYHLEHDLMMVVSADMGLGAESPGVEAKMMITRYKEAPNADADVDAIVIRVAVSSE